jgi:hypothetical protein
MPVLISPHYGVGDPPRLFNSVLELLLDEGVILASLVSLIKEDRVLNLNNRSQIENTINNPGDFNARLTGGAYQMPLDSYPHEPVEPEVMQKRVSELTDDELRSLVAVKVEYEGAQQAFETDRTEYHGLEGKLRAAFRRDLEAFYGMTDHPKADRLFGTAWEYGHSGGPREIALHYNKFFDLVK